MFLEVLNPVGPHLGATKEDKNSIKIECHLLHFLVDLVTVPKNSLLVFIFLAVREDGCESYQKGTQFC